MTEEGSGCGVWLVALLACGAFGWWYRYADNGPTMMRARVEVLEQRAAADDEG